MKSSKHPSMTSWIHWYFRDLGRTYRNTILVPVAEKLSTSVAYVCAIVIYFCELLLLVLTSLCVPVMCLYQFFRYPKKARLLYDDSYSVGSQDRESE